jgi:hypothetical protein
MKAGKPKNAKKEFIALLCMGIFIIIVATTCLLVFYRPFVNWKKLNFKDDVDGVVEFTEGPNATYYYTIDGVDYKVTQKGVGGANYSSNEANSKYILYINMDKPSDTKRGALGAPTLVGTLGFTALGVVLIWFGFHQKKSIERKQGKYTGKRKSSHKQR